MALKSRPAKAAKKDSTGARGDARSRLHAVAEKFAGFRPATKVLTRVRAVRTIFPAVDWATRVGGWPLERFTLLTGPSGHGKTFLAHGIGLSFLRGEHFYGLVDAEQTTPISWLESLFADYATHPGFVALRPETYEETVAAVRSFCYGIYEARTQTKNPLPRETTGVAVIDSIRKLVPAKMFETLVAEFKDKGGVDGASGRAGQIKAALNAAWVDELIPMLATTGTAMVVIARETTEQAGRFTRRKVGGGVALGYESSLTARVTYEPVKDRDGRVVGERHEVAISKTKVSARTDLVHVGWFYTRMASHPRGPGFWPERDVLELANTLGATKVSKRKDGTNEVSVTETGEVLASTKSHEPVHDAVEYLEQNPQTLAELDAACRARFEVEG